MTDPRRSPLASDYGIKDWDDLRLFLAVARGGHFQGAARILNANQTTVARRSRRMEQMLGTKLFERFGQELKLTAPGAQIFAHATAIEQLTQEVNERVRALDVRPCGTVKLAVTEDLATLWLTERLADFCRLNPKINLQLIPSDGGYDLLTSGTDVAIGWSRPGEPRLVGSRMGSIGFALFASKAYVRQSGALSDRADIAQHAFLQYDPHEAQGWNEPLIAEARALDRIRLRTSSMSIYLSAIEAGAGIGYLPSCYLRRLPDLVIMPLAVTDMRDLWVVSHEETNGFRRTRLLLDFLQSDFRTNGRWLFDRS